MLDGKSQETFDAAMRYRAAWLRVAFVPCALIAAWFFILPWLVGPLLRGLVWIAFLCLHCIAIAVMPFVARAMARRAVLRSTPRAHRRWLLSGAQPRWAVLPGLVHAAVMAFLVHLNAPFIFGLVGTCLLGPWWIRRAKKSAVQFATLDLEAPGYRATPVLQLRGHWDSRNVVISRVGARTFEVREDDSAESPHALPRMPETWNLIGPEDDDLLAAGGLRTEKTS